MIKRSPKQPAPQATPRGAAGKRVYAVGDVHGCHAALVDLVALIETDSSARPAKPSFLVFLGDIIDRGPASREVVECLRNFRSRHVQPVFIKGNHEDSLVRGLSGEPHLIRPWLEHGGYACAESYGLSAHMLTGQTDEALEHMLLSAVPTSHVDFMREFADSVVFGDYFLVHAGVRPGVTLAAQSPRDMRWIREPFLGSDLNFGAVVVHGHSVSDSVVIRRNRIGLDTGAYLGGPLSCVRIEDDELEVLQVKVA